MYVVHVVATNGSCRWRCLADCYGIDVRDSEDSSLVGGERKSNGKKRKLKNKKKIKMAEWKEWIGRRRLLLYLVPCPPPSRPIRLDGSPAENSRYCNQKPPSWSGKRSPTPGRHRGDRTPHSHSLSLSLSLFRRRVLKSQSGKKSHSSLLPSTEN